ncbi:NADH-quinone oxidoreductase subunit N [Cryptosporangium arvum]|uniref:NADH-quinone oxidoreductase subunit N n=1 Tax=Cryptosporangium arvum TaxID=80871 RepID=UPI0004B23142|nr:NADH-quinone oxidoreductase subunit N [Cryptosporangium arvum]
MTVQSVDHAALAPVYAVVAAAVLALLVDLALAPGKPRLLLLGVGALGPVAAIVAALAVGTGHRGTFCTPGGELPGGVTVGPSCSFAVDSASVAVTVLGCALALVVLGLSVPVVREAVVPPGEYVFLLLCSLTGLVVLASARDLLTLLVAVETLTLPVYVLVGLVRRPASAEAAVTFFVTSVVATTFTLLGIGLLYGVVGAVHLDRVAAALAARPDARDLPLVGAAALLVLAGLLFKLAATPFHAWAPATYDGAPLPVAAWLGTASKLGGAVAVVVTVGIALRPMLDVVGPVLAVVAVGTMTVGNLVALRQRRVLRLLAWSSVAQTGYLLAPLAVARGDGLRDAVAGVAGFTALYLVAGVGVFAAVVALRGAAEGGTLDDLAGAARRAPRATAALVLGLAGLAGLPPGLAGLFAKVVVIKATLDGSAGWLAVVIALNAVIGLAYYARVATACFAPADGARPTSAPVVVGATVAVTATAGVVLGAWPQWVFDAAASVANALL